VGTFNEKRKGTGFDVSEKAVHYSLQYPSPEVKNDADEMQW